MGVLRHIALNLIRQESSKGSVGTKRFRAALDGTYLAEFSEYKMRLPRGDGGAPRRCARTGAAARREGRRSAVPVLGAAGTERYPLDTSAQTDLSGLGGNERQCMPALPHQIRLAIPGVFAFAQ